MEKNALAKKTCFSNYHISNILLSTLKSNNIPQNIVNKLNH